jgi:hypothetical protein
MTTLTKTIMPTALLTSILIDITLIRVVEIVTSGNCVHITLPYTSLWDHSAAYWYILSHLEHLAWNMMDRLIG